MGATGKDCGSIIYGWGDTAFPQDGYYYILGFEFDLSQVLSISLNGEKMPITRKVQIPSGIIPNIVVRFKDLKRCDDMLFSAGSGISMSSADVSNLDTSNVVSMQGMFRHLTRTSNIIGLENLDTSNVKCLAYVLYNVLTSFEEGRISNWDTSKVTDFSYAFSHEGYVSSPTYSIDISGWDTSSAENMDGMFSGHVRLRELKMMGATNPNASVSDMFAGVVSDGVFYYNPRYDYSHIIAQLPSSWTAIPVTQ